MSAYAPTFFEIKHKSSVLYGARHLAELIQRSQFLPSHYRNVVNDTIQRNGYFGHAENVLISMLNDERHDIRLRAWKRIIESKQNVPEMDQVRYFKIQKFNFNCNDYTTMIDLENIEVTTPPILDCVEVTKNNIKELASKKLSEICSDIDLTRLPCHTQAVERCVKIVTEASAAVADEYK